MNEDPKALQYGEVQSENVSTYLDESMQEDDEENDLTGAFSKDLNNIPKEQRESSSYNQSAGVSMVEVNKKKKKKKRGSDPEDIFNTNDDSEEDEESKMTRQPGSPFVAARSDESSDDETGAITEKKVQCRKKTTLDVGFLTGKGSFLPITVLIHQGLIDPLKAILDISTGATIPHYACHHGNLKFMRFLENWNKTQNGSKQLLVTIEDHYNCTLAHYAARQGHLPVLMYIIEVLCKGNTDILKARDRFGYSVLDYTIVYKRLYCFIYVYYKCNFKELSQLLMNGLVESLCTGQEIDITNEAQYPSGHPQLQAFGIAQIMLRDDDLQKFISSIFLLHAIKHDRADILLEVYENCYYLPKLVKFDLKTLPMTQSIQEEQIQAILKQLKEMAHLSTERLIKFREILSGQISKKKEENKVYHCGTNFMKNFWFMLLFLVVTILVYLGAVMINTEHRRFDILAPFRFNGSIKMSTSILLCIMFTFMILSQIHMFWFLFIKNPMKAAVFKNTYERGNAVQQLAQNMKLFSRDSNFGESFALLNDRFDEIDFATNSFNSAEHDFCPVLKCKIYEDHGFSVIFNRSLNRENFPCYALSIIYFNWFLFFAVINIWIGCGVMQIGTNHQMLESSNKIFGIIEVHIKSILYMFSSGKEFMISMLIIFTEIFFTVSFQYSYLYLFAIGRKLTLREIRQPWLYTKTRLDVLFEMRPHIRRDFKKNKIIKQYYYEYSTMNNTMGVMLLNMLKYLFCINRNFRSDKPAPGQLPRLGHLEFQDVPQSDPFIKVHEVKNTKNFMNQEAETRSFDQISKHEYMGVDEN